MIFSLINQLKVGQFILIMTVLKTRGDFYTNIVLTDRDLEGFDTLFDL